MCGGLRLALAATLLCASGICSSGLDSTGVKPALVLEFFGSRSCEECMVIKQQLLQPMEKKHAGLLKVNIHDIEDSAGFDLMVKMEERYKLKTSSAQELYFPDTVLLGYDDIMNAGKGMIEKRLTKTGPTSTGSVHRLGPRRGPAIKSNR